MKNKLIFMMFTVSLLLTVSCTNDDYDNGEIKATAPKNIKLVPSNATETTNLMAIDSLGNNNIPQIPEPDGDPSNTDPR